MDTGILEELRRLSCNGSKDASLFLKKYYSDGTEKDDRLAYKYTCYAALSGDLDSINELLESGKKVTMGFQEDFDYVPHPSLDDSFREERREIRNESLYVFGRYGDSDVEESKGDNEGYIHPDSMGSYHIYSKTEMDPADLLERMKPAPKSRFRFMKKHHVKKSETEHNDGPLEQEDESNDPGYMDAIKLFYGIDTEVDTDAALKELVSMAENGDGTSCKAVVFITGFHPSVYDVRYPMYTEEEIRVIEKDGNKSDPRRNYYNVGDRMLIQDSIEWELIESLYSIDSYGLCYDETHENPEGGYGDDVLYTRLDDQLEPGPPTFIFKPSGYSMGWYKYAWRSPEQSENLSIGEILKIFRLCIEHKALGREIPKMTTEEALDLPVHLASVPDDLKERVRRICESSDVNLCGWSTGSSLVTFKPCRDGSADNKAKRVLSKLNEK